MLLFPILLLITTGFPSEVSTQETEKTRCVQCRSRAKMRPKLESTSMVCDNTFNQYYEGSYACLNGPSNDIVNQINSDYEDNFGQPNIGTCETDQHCYYRTMKETVIIGDQNSDFGENNDDYYIYTVERGCVYSETIEKFENDKCKNERFIQDCQTCQGELCNRQVTCASDILSLGIVTIIVVLMSFL